MFLFSQSCKKADSLLHYKASFDKVVTGKDSRKHQSLSLPSSLKIFANHICDKGKYPKYLGNSFNSIAKNQKGWKIGKGLERHTNRWQDTWKDAHFTNHHGNANKNHSDITQRPSVWHGELYSILYNNLEWKRIWEFQSWRSRNKSDQEPWVCGFDPWLCSVG